MGVHKVDNEGGAQNYMQNRLRGEVFSKFRDITAFARAMGWDRKKTSRIVGGKQSPTVTDMEQMAEVLGVTEAGSFIALFFPNLSTKWT